MYQFRFSDILRERKNSLSEQLHGYMMGNMFKKNLTNTAGIFVASNYEFIEEREPYFFILTNFGLMMFKLGNFATPTRVYYLSELEMSSY